MKNKTKQPTKPWKSNLQLFLVSTTIVFLMVILLLHHELIPKETCSDSRNIVSNNSLVQITERITTDNTDKLTNLMSYPYLSLTIEGGSRYGAFLSEDNEILVISGFPFLYPTQTSHVGGTVATWELNKDKDDNPLCYMYVGRIGSINRQAIAISPDNRYVLLTQSYHRADCKNYACTFVYDREHNVEIPYLEFDQYTFEVDLNHHGYIRKKMPRTPFCLDDFENPELFQFLSNQLDADKECIHSISLSSNENFVVALLAVKADGYYQFGRIKIWGIVD